MIIPKTLDEWDYNTIKRFVDLNMFETDHFDFKADLQPAENQERTVSAFANTSGGFFIFGIRDMSKTNRIVGIDKKKDFPKLFQDKNQKIEPSVYYEFKQPPVLIPNSDNVIHVCFIPKSSESPHMTRNQCFYIRTSGGNQLMTYNEIRESFYGFEQRKMKIDLLGLELSYLKQILEGMIIPEKEISTKHSLYEPNSSLLIDLLGQIYPIIWNDKQLVSFLMTIRAGIDTIAKKNQLFLFQITLPLTKKSNIIISHNKFIKLKVVDICSTILKTIKILQNKYGLR